MKLALMSRSRGWLAALAIAALGLTGCGTGKGGTDQLTVGFIYVGPKDDYGYNQAHALGAAAVKKIPGVKVIEQENVKETNDVQTAMRSMIEQKKAKLLFPTSFGYFDPHVLEVAKEFPDNTFLHCGGLWTEGKHPTNTGSYFGYIDECQYVSGVVAGHMSKTKKLGFVAAKPIPQVRRNINAFTLGARSVDPSITCTVIFTGDWSDSGKEAEALNTLLDGGADVITCHVDSPKTVVENTEKRGAMTCGYHASQAVLAPKGYLTGAEWNWEKVYTDYVNMFKEGKKIPNLVRGGLDKGIVKQGAYGPSVTPEAKKAADEVKDKLTKGQFVIFKGPLKDNEGKEILPAGKELGQTAVELEKMDYLVEGVVSKK
jgi:simple sugar transport system substrate-binding protein